MTLKICFSDPMLVKPKCVLEASIYFHFSAVCLQFSKKWRPPKHILALPTWGQKRTFSELKPFEIADFDLGHPVLKKCTGLFCLQPMNFRIPWDLNSFLLPKKFGPNNIILN